MLRLTQIKENSIKLSRIDRHSVRHIETREFAYMVVSVDFARNRIRSAVRKGSEIVLQKMGPQKFTFVAPPQKEYSTES